MDTNEAPLVSLNLPRGTKFKIKNTLIQNEVREAAFWKQKSYRTGAINQKATGELKIIMKQGRRMRRTSMLVKYLQSQIF